MDKRIPEKPQEADVNRAVHIGSDLKICDMILWSVKKIDITEYAGPSE